MYLSQFKTTGRRKHHRILGLLLLLLSSVGIHAQPAPVPGGIEIPRPLPPGGLERPPAPRPACHTGPTPTIRFETKATYVHLTWDPVPGASSYLVHRVDLSRPGGTPVRVAPVGYTNTDFWDAVPDPRFSYQYAVTEMQSDGCYGYATVTIQGPFPTPNPPSSGGRRPSSTTAQITWQPTFGAYQYRIYGPGFPNTGLLLEDSTFAPGSMPSPRFLFAGDLTLVDGKFALRIANPPVSELTYNVFAVYPANVADYDHPTRIVVPGDKTPVVGLADFHSHQFGYLGFGGTAISHSINVSDNCIPILPFEVSFVIRDIVRKGLFEEATNQASSGQCFPTFSNIASQRADVDNLKRAWQYGLRLMVMFAVSSEFLCEVAGLASPRPSDRAAVELQIQAAKDLQARIDNEAGGAGRGWYRIVTSPADARQVIYDGKLAVVLGIEAADVFGCRVRAKSTVFGVPALNPFEDTPNENTYDRDCDDGLIGLRDIYRNTDPTEDLSTYGSQATHKALALLEHYWALGVRDYFPTHNIDAVATGTALSIDLLHANVNPGNIGRGSPLLDRSDDINRVIRAIRPQNLSSNCSSIISFDGGRCNLFGFSDLGRELVRTMAANGAIIEADHMSLQSRRELEADEGPLGGVYPLISSHSGIAALNHGNANNEGQLQDQEINRIIRAGGAFAPRLPPVIAVQNEDTYPAGTTVAPHGCGALQNPSFRLIDIWWINCEQGNSSMAKTRSWASGLERSSDLRFQALPRRDSLGPAAW